MAQRFYFCNTAATYNPAVAKGAWNDTTNQTHIGLLNVSPDGNPSGTDAVAETNASPTWNVLLNSFVSVALWGNVTFATTDNVRLAQGVSESASGALMVSHVHIWVTTGGTDTVRGTLLSDYTGSVTWPTTAAGVASGVLPIANNVSALAGDHIVVELGYQAQNSSTTSFTGTNWYGATTPADLDMTQGDTSVTTHNGWIEFSTAFPATIALLGSSFNTNSGTHTVTATPTGNDLIVIVTMNTGSTVDTAPTDNNVNGGVYTQIVNPLKNSSADKMSAFVRTTFVQQPNSTIFTAAPGTTTGGGLAVYAIRGMARVGSNAVLQSAVQANHALGAAPAPAMGSTPKANNPILTGVFNALSPPALTAPTGFTRDVNTGWATPAAGVTTASLTNGQASGTVTWGTSSTTAFCSFAIEFDMSITTLQNHQDTFPGASLSTALWYDNTQSGGTQTVSGGAVHLTAPISTANALAEVETQKRFTLIGSYALVKAVITQVADANAEAGMTVYQDEQGNQLQLMVSNGNLQAGYIQRGTGVNVGSSISYNSTSMAWLRIRESAGTIFFDYAPDGLTWTNLASTAEPLNVSLVRSSVLAYDADSNATAEVGVFSSFNTIPSISTGHNLLLLGVGS